MSSATVRAARAALLALALSSFAPVLPAHGQDAAPFNGVTANVSDDTPSYGASVRVYGKVTNRRPGAKVRLNLVNGDLARTVATTTLNQSRRYSMRWTPPVTENGKTYVLQVVATKTARKATAQGAYFYVTTPDGPWDPQELRAEYLGIVNAARAERELPPLTMVPDYTQTANAIAKEQYEHGESLPEDRRWGRFPVGDVGLCLASNIGRDEYVYTAQEFDYAAEAAYFAVGIFERPDGRASVVIYTLSHNQQG